jgi:5-methylcytosine-specific restriction enzyme subunit McrC
MNGTPTVIREYASEVVNNLSDKDIAYLKKDCFKYSTLAPYEVLALRDNQVRIKNTSYSGIIQLENVRVHFSTKVRTNLFYMLSFLRDEKAFCYDPEMPIEIKEGANFFDILGRMFLNELDAIFQNGFYKSYVRKHENIAFIKGKMVFKEQLQNDVRRRLKFECSYEDLTYDNLENRIILKATTLLIPLIKFNDEIKRDLIRYSYLLREEVGLTNIVPDDCDRVQFSRLNEYYETAIRFSKVILQNYFIRSTYPGESIGFNFIVNMNKVYEDFITTMIEELVVEDKTFEKYVLEKQKRFDSLVEEKEIITRPDVILRRKDSEDDYPLIIDTKYKSEGGRSDYYQVIAYSLALPTAKSCCLIYPETEPVNTRLTLVANPNDPKSRKVKLYAVTINLDQELDFNNYVKAIKKDLKTKLLSCLEA